MSLTIPLVSDPPLSLLKTTVNAAVKEVPVVGPILSYFTDIFFPQEAEVDIWSELEGRIIDLVQSNIQAFFETDAAIHLTGWQNTVHDLVTVTMKGNLKDDATKSQILSFKWSLIKEDCRETTASDVARDSLSSHNDVGPILLPKLFDNIPLELALGNIVKIASMHACVMALNSSAVAELKKLGADDPTGNEIGDDEIKLWKAKYSIMIRNAVSQFWSSATGGDVTGWDIDVNGNTSGNVLNYGSQFANFDYGSATIATYNLGNPFSHGPTWDDRAPDLGSMTKTYQGIRQSLAANIIAANVSPVLYAMEWDSWDEKTDQPKTPTKIDFGSTDCSSDETDSVFCTAKSDINSMWETAAGTPNQNAPESYGGAPDEVAPHLDRVKVLGDGSEIMSNPVLPPHDDPKTSPMLAEVRPHYKSDSQDIPGGETGDGSGTLWGGPNSAHSSDPIRWTITPSSYAQANNVTFKLQQSVSGSDSQVAAGLYSGLVSAPEFYKQCQYEYPKNPFYAVLEDPVSKEQDLSIYFEFLSITRCKCLYVGMGDKAPAQSGFNSVEFQITSSDVSFYYSVSSVQVYNESKGWVEMPYNSPGTSSDSEAVQFLQMDSPNLSLVTTNISVQISTKAANEDPYYDSSDDSIRILLVDWSGADQGYLGIDIHTSGKMSLHKDGITGDVVVTTNDPFGSVTDDVVQIELSFSQLGNAQKV